MPAPAVQYSGRIMSEPRRPRFLVRWLARLFSWLMTCVVMIVGTLAVLETVRVRRMPALQLWQTRVPEHEFRAKRAAEIDSLEKYLTLEASLLAELDAFMLDPGRPEGLDGQSVIVRYVRGGPGDPATFTPNWNRTIELGPDNGPPRGAVLLLHGLTDSPYSMRSIAEEFRANGFLALCLRVPGHGTVPAGLLDIEVEDWMAAVRLGWRHLQQKVGPDQPLVLCGYSNGGALATLFTLELLGQRGAPGAQRTPDLLCLYSPAIGITPLAAASNVHRLYSWIPAFEKSKWLSVEPEFDPFKYNSFPKNAGAQSWRLTRLIESAMNEAVRSGRIDDFPPVLTFQSVVDATIVAQDVLTRLYDRLPSNGSEVVVFDVNHASVLDGFFANPHPPLERILGDASRRYGVTVVGSADPKTMGVVARSSSGGSSSIEVQELDLRWPPEVYSLAHVAIPFPEDDPLYGATAAPSATLRVPLGNLALRGERHVLTISPGDLLRLRHNPFHAYMMERMRGAARRVIETKP